MYAIKKNKLFSIKMIISILYHILEKSPKVFIKYILIIEHLASNFLFHPILIQPL